MGLLQPDCRSRGGGYGCRCPVVGGLTGNVQSLENVGIKRNISVRGIRSHSYGSKHDGIEHRTRSEPADEFVR